MICARRSRPGSVSVGVGAGASDGASFGGGEYGLGAAGAPPWLGGCTPRERRNSAGSRSSGILVSRPQVGDDPKLLADGLRVRVIGIFFQPSAPVVYIRPIQGRLYHRIRHPPGAILAGGCWLAY